MFRIKEMLLPEQPLSSGGKKNIEERGNAEGNEKKLSQYEEKIEDGIWIPSIFEKYIKEGILGVGAITKELKRIIGQKEAKIRITMDINELNLDQSLSEEDRRTKIAELKAGKILILTEFLKRIAPEIDVHKIEIAQLEHGDKITVVDTEYLKQTKEQKLKIIADGMITNLEGIPLLVLAADCAPVGIYDPENRAIGVFHSGRRGTLGQISRKGVEKMKKVYKSKPDQLLVVIGPHANGEKYEVGKEVYEDFYDASLEKPPVYSPEEINALFKKNEKKEGHYFLDVGQAIKFSLMKAGIPKENIQISKYSTTSEKGNLLFSSERVEGQGKERDSFAFAMVLKNKDIKRTNL